MISPCADDLLALALKAAAAASDAIMNIYRADADFGVVQKEDNTPVTRADMASNNAIISILRQSSIPILSEETAHEDYSVRRDYPRLWVVDPLDGTKEFIKRNDMFSVCIALVENHRPTLGVIALPTTSQVYFTRASHAFRATLSPQGEAISPVQLPISFAPVPHSVLGSVSHPGAATERVISAVRSFKGWEDTRLVPMGSSIKQCMIAEGSAALYPRQGTTMEWDTAAGQAIMEAVGAQLLRASDALPMTYNRPDLRNPDFLASAAGVPPEIVSLALQAVRG